MARRWIAWAGVLTAALAFQIFAPAPLSGFPLLLTLLLPLFSLGISLPGMFRCALTLACPAQSVPRGEECVFTLALSAPGPLSPALVELRAEQVNLLTGERTVLRPRLSPAVGEAGREVGGAAPHCGVAELKVSRARAYDLLGLFFRPLPLPAPARVLVRPRAEEEIALPPLPARSGAEGCSLRPRPGNGPGEDYELREFRPGDSLRSVHWKLTSKLDELVVRQTLEPLEEAVALTLDAFGPPVVLDRTLDRLYTLSLALLEREIPHHILWAHPVSGTVSCCPVARRGDLTRCLFLLCAQPAPLSGRSILDCPIRLPGAAGAVRRLHVTADGEPL